MTLSKSDYRPMFKLKENQGICRRSILWDLLHKQPELIKLPVWRSLRE